MEHEIIGHSKKALNVLKNPEKKTGEKFKEILTEILIIIFAVSLAALIERTREHYKERSEAKEFLIGLKGDIKNEIDEVKRGKKEMTDMQKSYTKIEGLSERDLDSISRNKIKESFYIPKFNTRPVNGRYDGFKASGRIQTIEDDSLRNHILKLYQEDIPFIDFSENEFNKNQVRLEDLIFANADDQGQKPTDVMKYLASSKGKLILSFALAYSNGVISGYDKMIKHAEAIEKEIDQ